ncbi:MAG: di-trans,poly-cis-decaprenylcistransferase, partial [Candidatus Aminicenantes bacterium]|nr:di-trans,poly-cis-decaprenylcistransferase [Candidatus Aminicenantes bacterium]
SLTNLDQASVREISSVRGIGAAKAAQLKAAAELGRRMFQGTAPKGPAFSAGRDVYAFIYPKVRGLNQEVFFCLLLDAKNRLIREAKDVIKGTLTSSPIHPREAFRDAIRESAASVIFASGLLLAAVTVTATRDQEPAPRPPGADTRDRYLNPRETDISLGLKVVSLYAFSTENWSRPKIEINALWRLLEEFFGTNLEKIKQKGIRIRHSGSLDHLPPATRAIIQRSVRETEGNRRIILNFCLNYGSRQEIVGAVNRWADGRKAGEKMTADTMVRFLDTAGLPDVDLLIRTSGESRVSNFLLWQIAYAELLFVKVLWPDFSPRHLYRAIYEFQKRERRYGGL